MKRKILSLLLCLALLLPLTAPAAAAKETKKDPIQVLVNVFSNQVGTKARKGLYLDNVFYLPAEDICELFGAKTTQVTASTVTFSLHDGLRYITVTSDSKVTETQGKQKLVQSLPAITYDKKLYISAVDILNYMGATVGFGLDEKAEVHMMVTVPYTVLDLFNDFADSRGYAFSWAEAAGKVVDPEDVLELAALDTVLLGYDSNVLAYALPGYGDHIEKSVHLDALLELLRVEGAELVSHEDPSVEILNYLDDNTEVSFIWIQKTMEWAAESDLDKKLAETWSDRLDAAGLVVDMTAGYISSLEIAKQFANLSYTQKNLMEQTLCRVRTSTDLYKQYPAMFEAAREAHALMTGEYSAGEKAAWDSMYNLMSNAVEMVVPPNPITLAWDVLTGIAKLTPLLDDLLEDEANITYASECSDIRILVNSLLATDAEKMDTNNRFLGVKDTMVQKQMKYDMILSLKASLTARLLLLETGWLTESAQSAMQSKAERTADLLNKAQNARDIALGLFELNEEDISWIEKLACTGGFGNVVTIGSNTYYWRYTKESFSEESYNSFGYTNAHNMMVYRDANGKTNVMYTLNGSGEFAVANGYIFYATHENEIRSISLDGKKKEVWGDGYLCGATEDGQYVFFTGYNGASGDTPLYRINVAEGTCTQLVSVSQFVTYHDGVIYYTKSVSRENAARGMVDLWSVRPDGSDTTHLYTTKADLYDSYIGYSDAYVDQIRFTDEYIYFSYGSLAGSGSFFQGGKVVRVRYDGTGGRVVAGDDALVGGHFSVSENGTVTNYDGSSYLAQIGFGHPFATLDGDIYIFNKESGVPEIKINFGEYNVVGSAMAGSLDDNGIVLIEYIEEVNGKVYCLLHSAVEQNSTWWASRVRQKTAMIVKDLKTGKVTVLYQL